MSETLLLTKLFAPPRRPNLVPRHHLLARLNQGLQRGGKLTLVSAPPGFGKTTLVSSWLQQCGRSYIWFSLDDEDNEPDRFLAYLLTALRNGNADLGRKAASLLESSQMPSLQAILTLVINDLVSLSQPIILVLEDYHVIHNLDIHKALAFL